ncbi:MAG: carboxypeptidase regulatory-like domain-containing protein [Planctomycetes bacterium]|nr:carboxypeptidase regulatory-like domain-containing protein [Planctomycetota bacterium]
MTHDDYLAWSIRTGFGTRACVTLEEGRALHGIVTSEFSGLGIPGIEVRVTDVGGHFSACARSNDKGHFHFARAPSSAATLQIGASAWWPVALTVEPGRDNIALSLEPVPVLVARVVDEQARPVPDVRLHIRDRLDPEVSDQEGRFRTHLRTELREGVGGRMYIPEQTTVLVEAPGFRFASAALSAESENVVRLQRVPALEVTVLTEAGVPIRDATVALLRLANFSASRHPGTRSLLRTDELGACTFVSRYGESEGLVVRAPGFVPVTRELEAGENRVEIRLRRGATVTGRVMRQGRPQVGVEVLLVRETPPPAEDLLAAYLTSQRARFTSQWRLNSTYSDDSGAFTFSGVGPGATGLVAVLPEGLRSLAALLDGNPRDLILEEALPLTLRVTSRGGDALKNVKIVCQEQRGTARRELQGTEGGTFALQDLPISEYRIDVTADAHHPARLYAWAGDECSALLYPTEGAECLEIRLVSQADLDVSQIYGSLAGKSPLRDFRSFDAPPREGTLRIPGLHAGEYEIRILVPEHREYIATVRLPRDIPLPVTLEAGAPTSILMSPGADLFVETLRGRRRAALHRRRAWSPARPGAWPRALLPDRQAPALLTRVAEIEVEHEPPANLDLRSGASPAVHVLVQDREGRPVPGAQLTLEANGCEIDTGTRTAGDGTAVLAQLIEGRILLRATLGEQQATAEVDVQGVKPLAPVSMTLPTDR